MEKDLEFPVFLAESNPKHRYTGFQVVHSRWGFVPFGRVQNTKNFHRGIIADPSGRVCQYEGSAGWPKFPPSACKFLDNLVIPGLVSKIVETFGYFGPRLVSCERCSLGEFKEKILAAIEVFGDRDFDELRDMIAGQPDYLSVIKAVEHWQYHGGKRDEDGHPKYLDDGSINPEYSP